MACPCRLPGLGEDRASEGLFFAAVILLDAVVLFSSLALYAKHLHR